jgi:hypothetical protein
MGDLVNQGQPAGNNQPSHNPTPSPAEPKSAPAPQAPAQPASPQTPQPPQTPKNPADGQSPAPEKVPGAQPGSNPEAPKADPKPGENQPGASDAPKPEAAKPLVPEKYEFKLPKGSLLDEAAIGKIASHAREQGLSQKDAQAYLERQNELVNTFAESQRAEHLGRIESWKKEAEADQEIGGEAFKQNIDLASRVAKRFGSENFFKELSVSGLGNHPELVRTFVRIGRAMSPDELVVGSPMGNRPLAIEDKFYGNPSKEQ